MNTLKVAITLDEKTLTKLDRLLKARVFPNRSKAVQRFLMIQTVEPEQPPLRSTSC